MLKKNVFLEKGNNTIAEHIYQLRSRTSPIEGCTSFAAKYSLAQHIFINRVNHMFNGQGKRLSIDLLLQGNDGRKIFQPSLSNEWGCLAQGHSIGVEGTDTIDFIPHVEVPSDRRVTHASFFCDHRPLKDEK